MIVLVYVDDLLIADNQQHPITELKAFLSSKLSYERFGKLKDFLGIEVDKSLHDSRSYQGV